MRLQPYTKTTKVCSEQEKQSSPVKSTPTGYLISDSQYENIQVCSIIQTEQNAIMYVGEREKTINEKGSHEIEG